MLPKGTLELKDLKKGVSKDVINGYKKKGYKEVGRVQSESKTLVVFLRNDSYRVGGVGKIGL